MQILVDSFVLEAGARDAELFRKGAGFLWQLTPAIWGEVAYQIEPFLENPPKGGFQWLMGKEALCDPTYSAMSVVITSYADGGW